MLLSVLREVQVRPVVAAAVHTQEGFMTSTELLSFWKLPEMQKDSEPTEVL